MTRLMLRHLIPVTAAVVLAAVAAATSGADAVVMAPVGAGTAAGASLVPLAVPHATGGNGGSGAVSGGAALYFETGNLTRGLPWSAIPASERASWHRAAAAGDDKLVRSFENSADASSIERRLVSSTCGDQPSSAGSCFLWFNDCPGAAHVLHRRAFVDAADRGQVACRTSNWLHTPSEFHTFAPTGGQAQLDELSQWEVQVWREGETRPIFERRVALDAQGHPLADADASTGDWWLSGGALGGATNAAAAGPLGGWNDASDPSYRGCASRYKNAPRVIVGSFDVDGSSAEIAYGNGALVDEAPAVGGSTYRCYWGGWSNGGRSWLPGSSSRTHAPCAACFYEGIELDWQVPRPGDYNGHAVRAKFNYRLLCRPNTLYAIRIVSLDHREQLLMTNALQPKEHVYWSQYFRVFMPTTISSFDFVTPVCRQCSPGN